jgi:hypothetical protein
MPADTLADRLHEALLRAAAHQGQDRAPESAAGQTRAEAEPDWTAPPCPHFSEMPAIQWKLRNLRKLRSSNPRKFADQSSFVGFTS